MDCADIVYMNAETNLFMVEYGLGTGVDGLFSSPILDEEDLVELAQPCEP
ncbi:hypothetical protein [Zhihengliuella halotolerans]|nr:hypothetical protein [Zhihengliuella halotolerans]